MILSFSITHKLAKEHNVPDPLFEGRKTVTRRVWKERTSNSWCKAYDEGRLEHKAYSASTFVKGAKQIGKIHLLERPFQQVIKDMPVEELEAEGGFWKDKTEFINLVAEGNENLLVWVVRFEFEGI